MNTLLTFIVVIQVLSALLIIGLVLLQQGKGADMGAAFGSGASGSLFGATGSSNFLSKSTGVAAAIFFAATLGLAFISNQQSVIPAGGVMDKLPASQPVKKEVPVQNQTVPSANTPMAPAGGAGQSNQIPK